MTTTAPFPAESPYGIIDAVLTAGGYDYRPSTTPRGSLHRHAWRDDAGTVVAVHSWDGYAAHAILAIENQQHDYDAGTYANADDPGGIEEGARRALALARRFSTLARNR